MDLNKNCPICDYEKASWYFGKDYKGIFEIRCLRCQHFFITKQAIKLSGDQIKKYRAILSGLFALKSDLEFSTPLVKSNNINELIKDNLIPAPEDIEKKAELLLKAIKNRSSFGLPRRLQYKECLSFIFSDYLEELGAYLNLLRERKYIDVEDEYESFIVTLRAEGCNFLKEKELSINSKTVFIAMKFDDDSTPLIEVIESVVKNCLYESVCIKEKYYSEKVIDKAIAEIKRSRFVIVDLSKKSEAVSYEAGFAHALGLKTIFIAHKKKRISKVDFYCRHYKISRYSDLDELKEILTNAINALII